MKYSAKQLSEIDDFQELLEEAANTLHMLVNEATNRDKYDVHYYLNSAQQVLDLIHERTELLPEEEE